MKATAWEFRFRVIIISALYFLGFYAPWLRIGPGATANPPRLWSWLAIEASRTGILPVNLAYLGVTALAILLAMAGALLRIWGTAYLGHEVMRGQTLQATVVMASGPYRYLRNPLYLGLLFSSAAIAVLMPVQGAVAFIVLLIFFTARLIAAEQTFLVRQLGEPYRTYCRQVPSVWPKFRPRVPFSGSQPRWGQSAVAEFFYLSTAACFAALAWLYDADLLTRAIIVCFGLALILHALISGQGMKRSTREL